MRKRSQSKRKKRANLATYSKKNLLKFIKNLTRRTSRTFKNLGKQKGG
jgi:hypothetical protein